MSAEHDITCAMKMQRIIAALSRNFLESSDFDAAIDMALKEMGEATQSDRCYLFIMNEDSTATSMTHEWCKPKISPQQTFQQNLPVSESPWWMGRLHDEGFVHVDNLEEMPPEAAPEKARLAEKDIRSFSAAGVWGRNRMEGFVGFDNCQHSNAWADSDMWMLNIFAHVIAGAIQRKRSEDALQRNEEYVKGIVESMPDPMYRYTPNWTVTFANEAYCRYYGKSREEIIGKTFSPRVPADFIETLKTRLGRISLDNPMVVGEEPATLVSGETRWHQWVDRGIFDDTGNLVEIQATGRDITLRKTAELRLEENRNRLHAILRDTDALICRFTMDGVLSFVNDAYCDFFGVKESDLLGRDFFGFIPEEQRENVRGTFIALTPENPSVTYEHQAFRADGALRWQRWTDRALFGEAGELVEYQSIGVDITDQVVSRTRAEGALAQMERTFENAMAAMARIVESRDPYTAGHQKRTAALAKRIAEIMGLDEYKIQTVYLGALLHDIGKIQVPSEILSKPAALTRMEFILVKDHPRAGAEILRQMNLPWPLWRIAAQHHERLDGSGYPEGLTAGKIGMESRILAVADVVDAMVSHRPYRPALSLDQALAEIEQNSGVLYDPDAARICAKLFREEGFTFEEKE